MALRDVKVRTAKPEEKAYKLTDGDGMVLLVHPNGSKYWRLRYRFAGKEKMLALGNILKCLCRNTSGFSCPNGMFQCGPSCST